MRGYCRDDIDQMRHLPAKKFSQRIGLRRQDDLGHFRARGVDRFSLERGIAARVILLGVLALHSVPRSSADLGSWVSLVATAKRSTRIIRDQPMSEQKKTRRQLLEEFVAKKPDDAFSRYGLAMECMNGGDAAAADGHFRALVERNSDYIPAYLMYGQLLAREARKDEAKQVLLNGISAASKKGDEHARSEMETLLSELS